MLSGVVVEVVARKAELRRRMRLVRDMIDDRLLRSVSIWSDLAESDAYRSASTVMAFVGVDGEPDTDPLVARLERDGKRLALPSVEDGAIVAREVGDAIVPGPYGIPTPTGPVVDVGEIDLVVVPGLAFTADGGRLGRGGGHYDRFLARLGAGCSSIGVCFAEQVVDDLPVEQHDRPVDRVVIG